MITFLTVFTYTFVSFAQCPQINATNSGINNTAPIPGCTEMTFCIAVTNAEDEEMEDILITLNGNTEFEVLNDGGFTQQGSSGIWQQLVTIPSTTEVTYCISFRLSPSWDDDPSNKIDVTAQLTYLTCNFGAPYEFNTIIPQFPFITIGSNPQQPILLSQIATYTGTGSPGNTLFHPALSPSNAQNFLLNGTLIVDESLAQFDYVFPDPSSIYMSPGASIIIENEQNLHLLGQNSKIVGCYEMWESITVEDGGGLIISKAKVEDGTNAIIAENGSTVTVTEAKFKNNRIGIQTPDAASGQNINFTVHNNLFESDELKPPLAGQIGEAGLDLNRVNGITLINNRFMNLANGILANRSNMTVVGGSFINMLIDNAPYTFKGYGIRTTGNFNFLNQIGLGTNTNFPTFDNCRYGVYSSGNELNISQNAMLDTWTGITARSNRVKVNLNNNNLFCERYGMDLFLNRAIISKASNNTITMDDDGDNGTAIRVAELGSSPSFFGWVLNENDITLEEARLGIAMTDVSYSNVKDNFINMNETRRYEGILLDGGWANYFICNGVVGANDNNEQWGMRATMTANQFVGCNAFDEVRYGINFDGMNNPTFFQGNEFNNHHYAFVIGNDLTSNPDMGGIIGVQEHFGNRWLDTYANGEFGAVHYGDNFEVTNSRLIYDPADGIDLVTNEDTPNASTTFFQIEFDGDTYLCPMTCPPDISEFDGGVITDLDDKIMHELLTPSNFANAQNWTAKRNLYRRLVEFPDLRPLNSAADTFYTTQTNTSVGEFEQIRADIADLYRLDSLTETELMGYQDDIRWRLDSLNFTDSLLISNPTTQDSIDLMAQKVVLLSETDSIMVLKDTLEATIESDQITDATQIKTTNDALNLSEVYELNQQTVNSVFLTMIINSQEALDSTQTTLIQPIANQCPLEGGEAVFQARALLNDGEVYDNIALCDAAQNRSLIQEDKPQASFRIYPNPAENIINLELEKTVEKSGKVFISDITGKIVLEIDLLIGDQSKSINIAKIPSGTYHLLVEVDGQQSKTELLVKIK